MALSHVNITEIVIAYEVGCTSFDSNFTLHTGSCLIYNLRLIYFHTADINVKNQLIMSLNIHDETTAAVFVLLNEQVINELLIILANYPTSSREPDRHYNNYSNVRQESD